MLASALEQLQRPAEPLEGIGAAIEHTAHASSSLYRIESEARTNEAAAHGIHNAVERLGFALEALSRARLQRSEYEAAATTLAQALALLYPVARGTERKRREVMVGHELSDDERVQLSERRPPPVLSEPPPTMRSDAPRPVSTPPLSERRSTPPRVRLEVDIGVFSESNFYAGLSLDVSSGGLFVSTHRALPPGTHVTLYFVLPNGHPVEARGLVCWNRGPGEYVPAGMGVRFTKLAREDLAHIHEYCRERPPLYLDPDD